MKENLDLFDFRMLPEEVASLGAINTPCRTCDNCYKCWGDPKSVMVSTRSPHRNLLTFK